MKTIRNGLQNQHTCCSHNDICKNAY